MTSLGFQWYMYTEFGFNRGQGSYTKHLAKQETVLLSVHIFLLYTRSSLIEKRHNLITDATTSEVTQKWV